MVSRCRTAAGVVITLVETEILRRLRRRFRSIHDNGIERFREQLGVMHIRARDDDGQRTAVGLDEEAALHPVFRTICGVRTDIIPPKRALLIAPSADCHFQFTPRSSSHCSTSTAQR